MASDPAIAAVEHKLSETLIKLKGSKDPHARKQLLGEMRRLIAELDRLVLTSIDSRVPIPSYICAICGSSVDLRTCKTDGNGKAVHSDCLTTRMKQKPATQP